MRIVGHGIDIVSVARVSRLVELHGQRFLSRVFTSAEQAHGRGQRRWGEHLAARFAAKEAALKALGTGLAGGVTWTEIGVEHDGAGRPRLRVTGRAGEIAAGLGTTEWWVSLSHTDGHAVASVIAAGE